MTDVWGGTPDNEDGRGGAMRGADVIVEVTSGDCAGDVKNQRRRSATISVRSSGQLHKYR